MCEEYDPIYLPGADYFTLNGHAFFRIISNPNNKMISATLFCLDENESFIEGETGIYPAETITEALLWDEEKILTLEYPPKDEPVN